MNQEKINKEKNEKIISNAQIGLSNDEFNSNKNLTKEEKININENNSINNKEYIKTKNEFEDMNNYIEKKCFIPICREKQCEGRSMKKNLQLVVFVQKTKIIYSTIYYLKHLKNFI